MQPKVRFQSLEALAKGVAHRCHHHPNAYCCRIRPDDGDDERPDEFQGSGDVDFGPPRGKEVL